MRRIYFVQIIGFLTFILLQGQVGVASPSTSSGMPAPTIHVVDTNNSHVELGTVGSPLVIVKSLYSTLIAPQPFICFFEVRDRNDVTQFLAWQSGTLKTNAEQTIGATWLPEKPGLYLFRSFAVSSVDNPEFVQRGDSLYMYVIKGGEPIAVGTGSLVYNSLDNVDVIGRVAGQSASANVEVILRLLDIEGEVRRDVVSTGYDGLFHHSYTSEELDFGEHTIIAGIEGDENHLASTRFTFGMPELRGVLDRLTSVRMTDGENRSYAISYAALKGNVTGAVLDDSGNYTLTFDVDSTDDDGLVIQFPLSFLDRMTPLGDRDVFCIIGDTKISASGIASGGYGTLDQNVTYYCPLSQDISSITIAANTDPSKQD